MTSSTIITPTCVDECSHPISYFVVAMYKLSTPYTSCCFVEFCNLICRVNIKKTSSTRFEWKKTERRITDLCFISTLRHRRRRRRNCHCRRLTICLKSLKAREPTNTFNDNYIVKRYAGISVAIAFKWAWITRLFRARTTRRRRCRDAIPVCRTVTMDSMWWKCRDKRED